MLWSIFQIAHIETIVSDVVVLFSRGVLLGQRDTLNVLDVRAEQGHSHLNTNPVHFVSNMKVCTYVVISSFDTNELAKNAGSVGVGDPYDIARP